MFEKTSEIGSRHYPVDLAVATSSKKGNLDRVLVADTTPALLATPSTGRGILNRIRSEFPAPKAAGNSDRIVVFIYVNSIIYAKFFQIFFMTTLRILLNNHLNHNISSLAGITKNDIIFFVEAKDQYTNPKHHQKKIAFLLSAMRCFAYELEQQA